MRTVEEIQADLSKEIEEYRAFRKGLSGVSSPYVESKIESLTYELQQARIREAQEKQKDIEQRAELTASIPLDRLREICAAERDGRCVVLPCKVGDTVYTVEEEYFDCDNCPHGKEARWNAEINRRACGKEDAHCPYSIEEHIVEGFKVCADSDGNPVVSAPGEWGYEGLERFYGVDGKWYPTREAAEAALAKEGVKP